MKFRPKAKVVVFAETEHRMTAADKKAYKYPYLLKGLVVSANLAPLK